MSRYLTTASNEFEADMILARLSDAGVPAVEQGTLGPRAGGTGARDIFVEEHDLARAREALKAAEDVTDEELTDLSERAGADHTERPG